MLLNVRLDVFDQLLSFLDDALIDFSLRNILLRAVANGSLARLELSRASAVLGGL